MTATTDTTTLADLAQRVAAQAQAHEDVEVFVSRARTTEIRAFGGGLESVNAAASEGVAVRVVTKNRQGFAYSGSLEEGAVQEALAEARDNARFAGEDEHNTIGRPDGVAPTRARTDGAKLADTPVDRKVDIALALEKAAAGHSQVRGVETAIYFDEVRHTAVATTTGILAESDTVECYLELFVLAGEGAETQTGEWSAVGHDIDDLDVDAVAQAAADRAVRLLGAKQPPSRRLTVVLDPYATSEFLAVVGRTLTGEAVLKGYSPFGDRLGDAIAASCITLVEDPTDPEAPGAGAFDDEGLATRRTPLIDGGRLHGFVHNTYSGLRSGQGSTGSAARPTLSSPVGVACTALALAPGTSSPEELIAQVGDGLLVQGLNGLHSGVNPISGDFSAGATGLMIRDGALAEPVREITIASTLQRMLQDVASVGNDVRVFPTSARGVSIAVQDVTMSGR
jgi:PmbA protein